MKKIIAALSICAIGALTTLSLIDNVKAEEIEGIFIPDSSQDFLDVNRGLINALIVRVGFKDYPVNETNPNYLAYSDDFLLSLYEGKDDGFGLPYNGLSDFLYTSSYGKLTMKVGEIIDIQLENTLDSYYNNYSGELKSINFYSCQEFIEKLNEQITISDYDANNDGRIDALYIWDISGKSNTVYSGERNGVYDDVKDKFNAYVAFFINEYHRKYEEYCLRLLIHETGHLLLSATDYYLLENAPPVYEESADIGSIYLGDNPCDYDGWTKYSGGWLTADNVSSITFQGDSTGVITLTPYDSDNADGKKLAILHDAPDSLKYIVVDYCGGKNNNGLDTNLRKEGFRFYKCAEVNVTEDIVYGHDNEGRLYQLFNDDDELEIEYPESGNRLKIYDIQTGDNPSFKYEYTIADKNDNDNNTSNEERTEPSDERIETSTNNIGQQGGYISLEDSKGETETKEQTKSDTTKDTSIEFDVKQPETVNHKSYGNVSKLSSITPQAQGVVTATNKNTPQTGDKNNTPLWITIAGASAGVLTTAVIARKRKRS